MAGSMRRDVLRLLSPVLREVFGRDWSPRCLDATPAVELPCPKLPKFLLEAAEIMLRLPRGGGHAPPLALRRLSTEPTAARECRYFAKRTNARTGAAATTPTAFVPVAAVPRRPFSIEMRPNSHFGACFPLRRSVQLRPGQGSHVM